MQSGIRLLVEESNDQKILRKEFDDDRICFGRNAKSHELEVWYKPGSSAPYKVCTCQDVWHAIKQLQYRARYDKQRSMDILKKIDDNNGKIKSELDQEAMHEIRSGMENIANGRKLFMPPVRRKTSA
jgi:hypothetical protein